MTDGDSEKGGLRLYGGTVFVDENQDGDVGVLVFEDAGGFPSVVPVTRARNHDGLIYAKTENNGVSKVYSTSRLVEGEKMTREEFESRREEIKNSYTIHE